MSDKASETRAEWRDFGSESEKRIRTGRHTSLARHDMGLSTTIGKTNRDASGRLIDAENRHMIDRLRVWDHRIQLGAPSERGLTKAFDELNRTRVKLSLSETMVEKAAYLYRKAYERKLVRGRSISSLLGACIYLACRELDTPITLKDITAAGNIKRRDVSRSYRLLLTELDIKVPLVDPMRCVAKIANKAQLNERILRQALSLMRDVAGTGVQVGKAPMCFAATVLYIACRKSGSNITQRNIAEAAGVTEVSIRNRVREFTKGLDSIDTTTAVPSSPISDA
ncbi:Transcription initiation factor IIB (TFIIB) [Candidatus Nitrososphaera evergladensis SR1]|uniref:Transcription initiation factor IIB n=1 Tax=Candidatus Nitrososphaera evergladensis SR1 TaxID=1459636 RepID=A0A075MS06_9ARCH|nr:Transcription initiation factor IIB (TFIIB) [Candidatus Nitrososphaera evergladensis SR1]